MGIIAERGINIVNLAWIRRGGGKKGEKCGMQTLGIKVLPVKGHIGNILDDVSHPGHC